nr:recombinase family protein [Bradyrhizobium canariense]
MTTAPLITYIRVSTSAQGRSSLGIEAQRSALAHFASSERYEVAREFVEVETGIAGLASHCPARDLLLFQQNGIGPARPRHSRDLRKSLCTHATPPSRRAASDSARQARPSGQKRVD